MPAVHEPNLDSVFAALADPTRRAMVERLSRGPASVGELSEPFDMSAPAISKHLRKLENAGLMAQSKRGRERVCRLTPEPIDRARQWMERHRRFWNERLDVLARTVESPHGKGKLK